MKLGLETLSQLLPVGAQDILTSIVLFIQEFYHSHIHKLDYLEEKTSVLVLTTRFSKY